MLEEKERSYDFPTQDYGLGYEPDYCECGNPLPVLRPDNCNICNECEYELIVEYCGNPNGENLN